MEQKKLQVCSVLSCPPIPVAGKEEYQLAVAPLYNSKNLFVNNVLPALFLHIYQCVTFLLQEALSKAAGKKSKTPVQLDLGDMLAALEKQQQAMKARQITNTRPLSYTGISNLLDY